MAELPYFETLAGSHLLDAIDALRNAGSSDALYDRFIRATKRGERSDAWLAQAITVAIQRRIAFSRHTTILAAFAAEAYVNEFLWVHVEDRQDRATLDRLKTVEKYIVVPRVALGQPLFLRDREPWGTLKMLFGRRNDLVHPKPRTGAPTPGQEPDQYNPAEAAKCIFAVADAAWTLQENSPAGADPRSVVGQIRKGREFLRAYARRSAESMTGPSDTPDPLSACRGSAAGVYASVTALQTPPRAHVGGGEAWYLSSNIPPRCRAHRHP